MALSKAEGLRSASSFATAAYFYVRLIPQDLCALHLDLFSLPSDFDFLRDHHYWYMGEKDRILWEKRSSKALLFLGDQPNTFFHTSRLSIQR